jgi:hypothetical protein
MIEKWYHVTAKIADDLYWYGKSKSIYKAPVKHG